MASTYTFLAFFAVFANALAAENVTQEPIKVTVYFESYCPDSVKFLTKDLFPLYLTTPLKDYMNITLVPYGKATTTKTSTGEYNFTCRHGEKECKGDKVIACVLKTKSIPFSQQLSFIDCTSTKIAANTKLEEYPVNECAPKDLPSVEILSCSGSPTGDEYLAEFGKMTEELTPALTSVPTVVFNDRYVESEAKMAVADFRKALCSKITGTKPAECLKNSAASLQSLMLPIVASLLFVFRL